MQRKDSQILPFHALITGVLVSGNLSLALNPQVLAAQGATRVLAVADNWGHFRVKQFAFRIHHGAITGDVAAGFLGGVQDTGPSSKAQVMELLPSTYQGATYTKPSEWVKVSPRDLAGPFPWYKTVPGTADATEEAPGVLYISGTAAETQVLEVRGVFEFKTSVAPANTPLAVKLITQLRKERERTEHEMVRKNLLRALAGDVPSTAPP